MPAVDAADIVLPPELVGKTPQEIAAFYQERQETIMANARRMVMEAREGNNNNPPSNPPLPNPNPPADQHITREEFNRMTSDARQSLVYVAMQSAKEGKSDWDRHFNKVKAIVESMDGALQIKKDVWEEAYYNVRGRATDTMIEEARRSALGLEPPSPPPAVQPKPRVYTDAELSIVEGMGITTIMYDDAEKKLDTNFQPFTTDNRRRA